MCAGFTTVLGAILGIGLLTSCGHPVPPQLVRDGAGLFSADARSAAEARLRDLAIESGVWAFVISDPDGDPPRMLDAPMAEADTRGVPAVAILFGPIGIVGGGHSDGSVEVGDPATLTGPSVDGFIARGDADAALAIVVDHLVAWVRAGPSVQGAPPVVEELGPSGTPSP